jgi:hypothetical protein
LPLPSSASSVTAPFDVRASSRTIFRGTRTATLAPQLQLPSGRRTRTRSEPPSATTSTSIRSSTSCLEAYLTTSTEASSRSQPRTSTGPLKVSSATRPPLASFSVVDNGSLKRCIAPHSEGSAQSQPLSASSAAGAANRSLLRISNSLQSLLRMGLAESSLVLA